MMLGSLLRHYYSIVLFTVIRRVDVVGDGAFLTMWTRGQVYVLHAGQSVELDCEFYAETFNMFKNPVVWKKHQRQEMTEINIMGNILSPFLASGRFVVSFDKNPPRYRMTLRVTDLSLEDSGNYTCEVRGPRANTLGDVTHYIFIRAPVQSVFFSTRSNATSTSAVTSSHDVIKSRDEAEDDGTVRQLTFVAGIPSYLACVAVGGYPPPDVRVHLGQVDITDQLTEIGHRATLIGEPGLRQMLYRTQRSSDAVRLTAGDDTKRLACTATVSDIGSAVTTATLLVYHAPVVHCITSTAHIDDRNVYLQCNVRARPALTSLYWQTDSNGTTVAEGRVKEEYWTLVMERTDGTLDTRLFMRKAHASCFRSYQLFAQNDIGTTTAETQLLQRYRVPVQTSSTLALYDSYDHNKDVQFVADQAANRVYHQSDVILTSSTDSQSSRGFHDVILTWAFSAGVAHRLLTTAG